MYKSSSILEQVVVIPHCIVDSNNNNKTRYVNIMQTHSSVTIICFDYTNDNGAYTV